MDAIKYKGKDHVSSVSILEQQAGKDDVSSVSSLVEQGRAVIFGDTPIFYILGYVVALYLAFYFITFYIGPALFGHRPYWKRSLDTSGMPPMMVVNPLNSAQLTESVHSALEKHGNMQ